MPIISERAGESQPYRRRQCHPRGPPQDSRIETHLHHVLAGGNGHAAKRDIGENDCLGVVVDPGVPAWVGRLGGYQK